MSEKKQSKLSSTKVYGRLFNVRYALLAALCTTAIMLIVYYCYDLIPFGNITILRMDLYHQYGPLFAELYERVKNFDSLLYSWKSGGGGGFLGNFYNYLSSPFALVMLVLGHKNMPEAISWMILLKSATASFTFAYFLTKKYGRQGPLTAAFGVLYACCGYFIAYYWNVMWLDSFYLFPLVILGIEKLITERKMKLYIVTLAITFITNYYMAYMVCIFSVLYFIYCYFCNYSFAETYFGRLKKRQKGFKSFFGWSYNNLRNSRFFDSGVRFALSSLSAALLSAFSLVPVYYALKNCSATSGSFPEAFKTYFTVFDFLANHLAYLDPTIRSSGTDVLPNIYCGILPVMLVPLFLFSEKISSKEKIFSVGFLGIMFASCYTNYLNFIWHGFHFPNDLPYRFSYMYSFLLLIFAFRAINLIREYSKRQIIGVGTATVFFIILVQEIGSKNFSETGVWICIAFIGIYCMALGILRSDKYPRIAAAALILCAVCAEYTVANTNNYSMDQPKENFVGDYSDFTVLKSKLDEYNGSDDYRMELTSLRARMDPCWYYYNGLSTFSSMANENVSNMQYHLGMFGNFINSYTYHRQTPVYNAFFSLDYVVDNDTAASAEMNSEYYKSLFAVDKFKAYENNYSLPIAFRANPEMATWSHDNSNPFEVQSGLFESATGYNNVYTDMIVEDVNQQNLDSDYYAYEDGGCYPFTVTGTGVESAMTFGITAAKDGNAYVYFKSGANNVERITVTLPDGTAISQPVDTKPFILDLGYLKKDATVNIYAPIKEGTTGYLYLYGVSLNEDVFKKGYEQLKEDGMTVTSFNETDIKGTVNASEDGVLFTSINYDTGWSVYVDNQKVSAADIISVGDALLGINITEGEHSIEFRYMPEGLITGVVLTVLILLILLVMSLLIKTGFFVFSPRLYDPADDISEEAEDATGTDGTLNGRDSQAPPVITEESDIYVSSEKDSDNITLQDDADTTLKNDDAE